VGGTTESKRADVQAGFERMGTLLPAVLAEVNLITCAGTLDGTMLEDHALLLLDDEFAGAALRIARGINVSEDSLSLELIKRVGFEGNYLQEDHTAFHFRDELFIPKLYSQEPYDTWEKKGRKLAIDKARERAREILSNHKPRSLDPVLTEELESFRKAVATRSLEDFYLYETLEKQDFGNL
jgi:trimethylamine--corrinoid protein Co-methyltransferase